MTASELFQAGKLDEAIAAQTAQVKASPGDQAKRLFLFELLAFAGELDRARRQIDALQYEELELQAATADYRKLLDAEETRRKVFREGLQPKFLEDVPPEHVRLRLEALHRLHEGNKVAATESLAQAAEAAPPINGKLNEKAFADLRDCDDLFGTVLEVFSQGNYFWVPLETIESIALMAPRFPRDLLWIKARLETAAGAGQVFLPAIYPGSHGHPDQLVRLGRQTDWADDGGPVLGLGLRMFLAGDDASTILEWRDVQIDPQPGQEMPAAE
ncbi:MAG TPA: type VI secretion system accessory protein TagJ [Pirellulales bacterium]|jgi:type VI secretion system protein ImpE|nr:type VI secretion system accessory protein TagJ [Pirellulales bacterium]